MCSERMADILANVLGAAILLLMIFLIVSVPAVGLGIALGYGLHALIPGLDLGWAIVAGAVFATGIVDMTARFLLATRKADRPTDEEDVVIGAPWITIPRSFFPPAASRKRGRKKR